MQMLLFFHSRRKSVIFVEAYMEFIMLTYFLLFCAIFFEVSATMLLITSDQFAKLSTTVSLLLCYGFSMYLLSIVVTEIPIAVVYATWSALGIAATSFLGFLLYEQSLNWQVILGFMIIFVGVLIVNYYAPEVNLSS